MDGGSSVAVLTYLRCILQSISHPDLIRIMLQYLLAIPEPPTDNHFTSRPTTLARRRKSQTLIINLAKGEEKPSPDLFTLVDLISTSLQSNNQQTVTAALRLCSAIISTHHDYAIQTLIRIQPLGNTESRRTLGSHNVEVHILLSMAEEIATEDGLVESYESHLEDVRIFIEAHSCSARLLALPRSASVPSKGTLMHPSLRSKAVRFHTISTDDPLLRNLLSLLDHFLVNDIETNLSLTHVLVNLASCGYTHLEGWFLGNGTADGPNEKGTSPDEHDSSDDADNCSIGVSNENSMSKFSDLPLARQEPTRYASCTSPVFAVLNSLIQQVETLRLKFQDFDTYLAERKHIFKIGEEIDSALSEPPAPPRKSEDQRKGHSAAATLHNQNQVIGSISQRLMSESNSPSDVSRSSSPRGRQQSGSSTSGMLAGRLNPLRVSPSPNPIKRGARNYSSSPFRAKAGVVLSTTPPRRVATPMGPPGVLHQKVKIPPSNLHDQQQQPLLIHHTHASALGGGLSSETSSVRSSDSAGPPAAEAMMHRHRHAKDGDAREVSLGHVLTNVVILQEFMLELAALVEVRAGLFDEVRFV